MSHGTRILLYTVCTVQYCTLLVPIPFTLKILQYSDQIEVDNCVQFDRMHSRNECNFLRISHMELVYVVHVQQEADLLPIMRAYIGYRLHRQHYAICVAV